MAFGMLIDYGLCTGCMSCVIACRKEHGLPLDEWGISVEQIGPARLGGAWEWDYVPVPSRLCDLCDKRREQGKKASCELHCLANVIEVLPIEDAPARIAEIGRPKMSLFVPRA